MGLHQEITENIGDIVTPIDSNFEENMQTIDNVKSQLDNDMLSVKNNINKLCTFSPNYNKCYKNEKTLIGADCKHIAKVIPNVKCTLDDNTCIAWQE